jgi:ring-1,2-phenylacetyl-CoA epoxidase subunit PaaB
MGASAVVDGAAGRGEPREESERGAAGGGERREERGATAADSQWPLWEVFVQPGDGAPHEHAGSVHAVDAEHALQNARDVYARRGEGINIWVVPTAAITASTPEDVGPFFDPANDKPYRHPQFYKVPRGIRM